MKIYFSLLLTLTIFTSTVLFSQTADEVKSSVPELTAFHEVIYKLWHDAWPKKDIGALTAMVPDIEQHLIKIQKAKLPGILREKNTEWKVEVNKLAEVTANYKSAITSSDTQKILDAAENLHSQYESMVRVIRPPMKEIDVFHRALYPLYHYHMPKYDREKIRSSVSELKVAMDSLAQAELPERFKKKEKIFLARRGELKKAVNYLDKVVTSIDDEKTVKDAIKELHAKYQALEKALN